MSEQYPLLYDEVSEEEQFSPRFHQRLLMSRARARNQVKGAAAIITRWPEHWTWLLNCWWMGITMIALTTFLAYNFLSSYAAVPEYKPHPKHPPIQYRYIKPTKVTSKPSSSPKVFMHLFVDDKQEIDLNNYLPYIEIIANKYKHFKYELIVVANDTNVETKYLNDKEMNELALNMLWTDDLKSDRLIQGKGNVDVKYVTLSQYLHNSPLQKYWKILPHQFMRFLVRAVSVWEKGGIAFDPIVLTPQSPHSIYIDKVNNILRMYKINTEKVKSPESFKQKIKQTRKLNKLKTKPNNIRDIINQLENEDPSEKLDQDPLAVAESKDNLTVTNIRTLRSVNDSQDYNNNLTRHRKVTEINDHVPDSQEHTKYVSNKETTTKKGVIDSSPKLNLLPMFLEYLFHKPTNNLNETTIIAEPYSNDDRSTDMTTTIENKSSKIRQFWNDITDEKNYKPMIVSAKAILNNPDNETKIPDVIEKKIDNLFEVTIDLKGNIIAADTPCHAFIGDMFINAIHHDQSESITDFIIQELSLFCKGLLASCVGIDVILL